MCAHAYVPTLTLCLACMFGMYDSCIHACVCFKYVCASAYFQSVLYARYGLNKLVEALSPLVEKGLKSVLIFGVPTEIQKVCRLYTPMAAPTHCVTCVVMLVCIKRAGKYCKRLQ